MYLGGLALLDALRWGAGLLSALGKRMLWLMSFPSLESTESAFGDFHQQLFASFRQLREANLCKQFWPNWGAYTCIVSKWCQISIPAPLPYCQRHCAYIVHIHTSWIAECWTALVWQAFAKPSQSTSAIPVTHTIHFWIQPKPSTKLDPVHLCSTDTSWHLLPSAFILNIMMHHGRFARPGLAVQLKAVPCPPLVPLHCFEVPSAQRREIPGPYCCESLCFVPFDQISDDWLQWGSIDTCFLGIFYYGAAAIGECATVLQYSAAAVQTPSRREPRPLRSLAKHRMLNQGALRTLMFDKMQQVHETSWNFGSTPFNFSALSASTWQGKFSRFHPQHQVAELWNVLGGSESEICRRFVTITFTVDRLMFLQAFSLWFPCVLADVQVVMEGKGAGAGREASL